MTKRVAKMVVIWDTVLCLPSRSAAKTTFLEAASRRSPVIASSRPTITATIQASICLSSMKAMKAEQVRILSAKGSISVPKAVINLRSRAIFPSKKSVRLARLKRTNAHERFPGNGANAATQNKPVSAKRETVNWFGRFISRFSVS